MNHLQKLKSQFLLKWVSSVYPQTRLRTSTIKLSILSASVYTAKNSTFYTSRAENCEKDQILEEMKVAHCKPGPKYHSSISKAEAQTALLEYLHVTRNLPFTDAEYMSKNSPLFIKNLLKNVEVGQKIKWSLMKFFCYHPINEFEPFFESMGLTGSELDSILPRDLLCLKDDGLLLENYHALCNYGVPRGMIGKIYREAKEVFRYDYGVLHSTLYSYKDMGLSQTSVIKVVVSSPSLLIGGVNGDFRKVLDMFRSLEIDFEWIEECISDNDTYDWSQVLGFLNFVCRLDYSKEELRALVKTHPGLLLEGSGRNAFHLVKILLKLGFTGKEVASLLLRLPQIQVGTFAKNLDRCLSFLMHIEMDSEDIARIVRAHTVMLGTLYLKKANTVQNELSIGRTRLCKIVKGNPYQLKNWALGMKLEPLRNSAENQSSLMQKKEFLLNLGYIDNSDDLNKALKAFRGKGGELQGRFDCLLKAGVDSKDIIEMVKLVPKILNHRTDVLERKIDFLLNGCCYPVSCLVGYPSLITLNSERVRLRLLMYSWLRDEGVKSPHLSPNSYMTCSDKIFIKRFVNRHPGGPEVWESIKKEHRL